MSKVVFELVFDLLATLFKPYFDFVRHPVTISSLIDLVSLLSCEPAFVVTVSVDLL